MFFTRRRRGSPAHLGEATPRGQLGPWPAIRYQVVGVVDRKHAMTKTGQVSLLRQGKAAWVAWREANPSIHPDLREANLSGANLSDAELDGADLSGANLNRTNLSLANLSNAQLTGVQWQLRAMRGCYLGVRGLDSCFGNALFKRAAADQDFLDTLEAHLKGTRGMALFRAWGLIDYGRSLLRVAAISFGLAGFYGVIYRIFPHILDYKDSANTWFTPYYFSIVTYTTLGFGDVRPATLFGEIIVSSEVILGYTTLGLLLSVLAQNIARRS